MLGLSKCACPKENCRYRAPSALSALSRGEELVANAEAELSRHDAGAEMLADAAAKRVAAEAVAGRHADLSDDGAEDRIRRRQVIELKLRNARKAHGLLEAEVEVAKQAQAKAAQAIDDAIDALVRERGELVAGELLAAEAAARDRRLQLRGLAGLWRPRDGKPTSFTLGKWATACLENLPLNDDRRPRHGPAHIDPASRFAQEWQRTIATLRDDPDAPLPITRAES